MYSPNSIYPSHANNAYRLPGILKPSDKPWQPEQAVWRMGYGACYHCSCQAYVGSGQTCDNC